MQRLLAAIFFRNPVDVIMILSVVISKAHLKVDPLFSHQGQDYLAAMACAANFAFCNRAVMAAEVRRAFATVFGRSARDLGMHQVRGYLCYSSWLVASSAPKNCAEVATPPLPSPSVHNNQPPRLARPFVLIYTPSKTIQVYDVSHNIAKFEEHVVPDVTLTSRGCGGGYSAATAAGSGGEEAATRLGAPSPAAAGTSEGGGETEAAGGAAGFSTAEPDAAAAASAAPAGGAAPAVETGASATTGGRAAGKQKVVETGGIGRAAAGKTMKAEKTKTKQLLVHRKGATRAFAPGHPALPAKYAACGQPVLIGGSMGTASYVMAGTQVRIEGRRSIIYAFYCFLRQVREPAG